MADNGKAKLGSGAAYTTNLETFSKRLKVFYDHWNENKSHLWASSDAIAIVTPPPSEDLRHLKSTALDVWLLGYDEFPETIIVFMQKQIHFLCSEKKANLIGTIKDATAMFERNAPELLPNLTKSAGTGIGLEFRESGLNLTAKNDRLIKEGMTFNVNLGLSNVQAETNN
uniref:FACT complex subunit n=1 Tax=Aegilops tauschii TaxID=37682 RepID=M8B3I9_AEGTA